MRKMNTGIIPNPKRTETRVRAHKQKIKESDLVTPRNGRASLAESRCVMHRNSTQTGRKSEEFHAQAARNARNDTVQTWGSHRPYPSEWIVIVSCNQKSNRRSKSILKTNPRWDILYRTAFAFRVDISRSVAERRIGNIYIYIYIYIQSHIQTYIYIYIYKSATSSH